MLTRAALVRTDVSEDCTASSIKVRRIGELGTLAAINKRSMLRATATRRNIPEDGILHSQCRESLKSYIALTGWAL
jgi:hypothetical protein